MTAYATVSDFRAAIGTDVNDTADDAYITSLLDAATNVVSLYTGRSFQPQTKTLYHDTPNSRTLWLDDDLLSVTSITNGDGTVIASTEYTLRPLNDGPRYAVVLNRSSAIGWETDADGNPDGAIAIEGSWGYSTSVPAAIKQATLIIATAYYRARYGNDTSGPTTITPSGIILTEGAIPKSAQTILRAYLRQPTA